MDESFTTQKTPNFILNSVPEIRIRSLHVRQFKAYDDFYFDFSNGSDIKQFVCFIGENGTGKSTVLNVIQMLFQRYDGYSEQRMLAKFGACVRHTNHKTHAMYTDEDFLIEAEIESEYGNYTVCMNKRGFVHDHPQEIKQILYRLCYFARFDKELDQFQLIRDKWDYFKDLFESVTNYEIEEISDVFSSSSDPEEEAMAEKYVLGFTVKKPFETIFHRECSNGEKKVIKSFSTLLNLEIQPRIILIDDIAMHVALGRHMALIEAMQKCYPKSQIFSTTHSYRMMKNLKKIKEIYDLRIIHANTIIKAEPWRLRIIDEIDDAMYKIEDLDSVRKVDLYNIGKKLRDASTMYINDLHSYQQSVSDFLKEVSDIYVIGVMSFDQ
jgi:predicted ATPase